MIEYEARGPDDLRTLQALRDIGSVVKPATLVGAWMTRVWLLSAGTMPRLRRTNDVDIALTPATPSSAELRAGLERLGYEVDTSGYPFRFQRMSEAGLLIIDLLVDESRAKVGRDAQPVYGLDFAVAGLTEFTLRLRDLKLETAVAVPDLDRAAVLRVLALEQGTANLKFVDYAKDAALLAELCLERGGARSEIRRAPEFERARAIASPLFGDLTAPGARAAAQDVEGDPDLAARRASASVLALLS